MRHLAVWTVVIAAAMVACGCSGEVGEDTGSASSAGTIRPGGPGGGITFAVPAITSTSSVLVPGLSSALLQVNGTGFGASRGRVVVVLDTFLGDGIFGSDGPGAFDLENVTWSDTRITGDWPTITGFLAQPAQVEVIAADGTASNAFSFTIWPNSSSGPLPGSAVRVEACSPNADSSNTCTLNAEGVTGQHVSGRWPEPEVAAEGWDYYVLPALANTWQYLEYDFSGPSQTYGVVDVQDLLGFSGGSSQEYIGVHWSTAQAVLDAEANPRAGNPPYEVRYDLTFTIVGPSGTSY